MVKHNQNLRVPPKAGCYFIARLNLETVGLAGTFPEFDGIIPEASYSLACFPMLHVCLRLLTISCPIFLWWILWPWPLDLDRQQAHGFPDVEQPIVACHVHANEKWRAFFSPERESSSRQYTENTSLPRSGTCLDRTATHAVFVLQ